MKNYMEFHGLLKFAPSPPQRGESHTKPNKKFALEPSSQGILCFHDDVDPLLLFPYAKGLA